MTWMTQPGFKEFPIEKYDTENETKKKNLRKKILKITKRQLINHGSRYIRNNQIRTTFATISHENFSIRPL